MVSQYLKPNAMIRSLKSRYREVARRWKIRKSKRKVFIDCGANTCTVLRGFIERFPAFEFFAFEAQPELAGEGEKLKADFPDAKLTYFNKAVWTKDSVLEFYLATEWGPNHKGGSTLLAGHVRNNAKVDYQAPAEVAAIDFSKWLRDNFSPEDFVMVKMDIEGAEYDVLEKVIRDGNLGIIDELIIEFHHQMNDSITEDRHNSLLSELKRSVHLEYWY